MNESGNNALKFYDSVGQVIGIGTSSGTAIQMTMSTVSSTTGIDIQNSINNMAFGINLNWSGTTNTGACIQMVNAGISGAFGFLGTFSNGAGAMFITQTGTKDVIEILNGGSGIAVEIINSGNYSIPAIKITNSGMTSANPTGIYMQLGSGAGVACYAFDFEGSEVVSSAVVGTQNRKIKVLIGGATYFIPAYDG
jgi:hypothetical protein